MLFRSVSQSRYWWWRAIFANLIIDGHRLVRLDVATKDYAVMKVQSPDGVFMSVSKLGELRNAHVTVQDYETVKSIAKLSKIDIAWPTVSSTLQTNKASATLLAEFFRDTGDFKPPVVYPIEISAFNYTPMSVNYTPSDDKPSMVPFMAPICVAACVPSDCPASDQLAVEGRVLNLRKKNQNLEMTALMDDFINEFIGQITDHMKRHNIEKLVPVTLDEVYSRQSRPTQRRILDESLSVIVDTNRVASFLRRNHTLA